MKLTLLDTKTGKTKEIDDPFSDFWWAEGNGSCDCNRAREFNSAKEELDREHKSKYPELYDKEKPWQTYCLGCFRFLIIGTDSTEYILEEFNSGYPVELVSKYCD